MKKKQKIIVSPLDWGLGHATRLIPIIQYYLREGDEVIIAGYGKSLELLKIEYPQLKFEYLPGFRISYSPGGRQSLKISQQLPSFFYWKRKERIILKKLIQLYNPDVVISDNRYGLTTKDAKTVVITHQLRFLFSENSLLDRFIQRQFKRWIEKFDECWIPDVEGAAGLTGKMTQCYYQIKNAKYIGWLSRFKGKKVVGSQQYDIVAVVSGPEPQRTILFNELKAHLLGNKYHCLLVSGVPDDIEVWDRETSNLHIVNHLSTDRILEFLSGTKIIICRSGYSSIMDILALNKRAILIPTPGQLEQEYLSNFVVKNEQFNSIQQNNLDRLSPFIELFCDVKEVVENQGKLFFPDYFLNN